MKHTRYFSTYLDAYNYYPNGVPSTEIALVGDASYIFVSTDNTYSGNTTFFDAGMTNDQIVDTMTEAAYTNGYTSGYDGGYSYGYSYGYTEGEAEGYDDGYDEGYDEGYSYGYTEGSASSSLSLEDLTYMEMGMQIKDNKGLRGYNVIGSTHQYSIQYDQQPDAMYARFSSNDLEYVNGEMQVYKIDTSNELSKTSITGTGSYWTNAGSDPEYGVGSYGYVSLNLQAGEKVGFYILDYYDPGFDFMISTYPESSDASITDHWLTAGTTGTYMLKYEITGIEYEGTPDQYYTIVGTFGLAPTQE